MPTACVLVLCKRKMARERCNLPERANRVELLTVHPAAQFAVRDAESTILVKPLSPMPSAPESVTSYCLPKSHDARRWIAREESLGSHRAYRGKTAGPRLLRRNSPCMTLRQQPSSRLCRKCFSHAHSLHTGMVYDSGAPVKGTHVLSEHADVELLVECPARNSRCMRLNQQHRCRKCRQHSHRPTETSCKRQVGTKKMTTPPTGGVAGWVLCGAINGA